MEEEAPTRPHLRSASPARERATAPAGDAASLAVAPSSSLSSPLLPRLPYPPSLPPSPSTPTVPLPVRICDYRDASLEEDRAEIDVAPARKVNGEVNGYQDNFAFEEQQHIIKGWSTAQANYLKREVLQPEPTRDVNTEMREESLHSTTEKMEKDEEKEREKERGGDENEEKTEEREKEKDEEDYFRGDWRLQKKHVFIISDSGKPVYSRYGDANKLCGFFGLLYAINTFISDRGDSIRTVIAGQHKMVFVKFGLLHLVAVSRTGEPSVHLIRQLKCMHSQILSTVPGIDRILLTKPNFDIRGFLTGTDKFFFNLIERIDLGESFLLGGIRCLRLPPTVRYTIGTILKSVQTEDLAYGIILAKDKVVHYARPWNHPLKPIDLELVINFIKSSPSLTKNESWVPLCLPEFNDRGYLYAYICYLIEDVCLILLSTNQSKEKFFEFSNAKNSIYKALLSANALRAIHKSMTLADYSRSSVGIEALLHFMYKSLSLNQITCLALKPPYNSPSEKERLYRLYQYAQHQMNKRADAPNKVFYLCGKYENLLCWKTDEFELYAAFWPKPLTTLHDVVKGGNQLLSWIKKTETTLFINDSSTPWNA